MNSCCHTSTSIAAVGVGRIAEPDRRLHRLQRRDQLRVFGLGLVDQDVDADRPWRPSRRGWSARGRGSRGRAASACRSRQRVLVCRGPAGCAGPGRPACASPANSAGRRRARARHRPRSDSAARPPSGRHCQEIAREQDGQEDEQRREHSRIARDPGEVAAHALRRLAPLLASGSSRLSGCVLVHARCGLRLDIARRSRRRGRNR